MNPDQQKQLNKDAPFKDLELPNNGDIGIDEIDVYASGHLFHILRKQGIFKDYDEGHIVIWRDGKYKRYPKSEKRKAVKGRFRGSSNDKGKDGKKYFCGAIFPIPYKIQSAGGRALFRQKT